MLTFFCVLGMIFCFTQAIGSQITVYIGRLMIDENYQPRRDAYEVITTGIAVTVLFLIGFVKLQNIITEI